MLALKQALSLVSTKKVGGTSWNPILEPDLKAWYKYKNDVELAGNKVERWSDSSSNNFDMLQADDALRPIYNVGTLTFDSSASTNLQSTGQISISSDFIIGIRMRPNTSNGTFIGNNTVSGELFKYSSTSSITIKIDNSTVVISLDSGTFGDDSIILSRDSNVFTLYKNGVAQSNTPTLGGTIDIDNIGIRKPSVNGFTGDIKEVQIYTSTNQTLIANINARLSTL